MAKKRTNWEPHNVACGMVIRQLRLEKEYSQDYLALAAQVDRTYIYLIETGLRSPKLDTIFKICQALDIGFAEFATLVVDKLPDAIKKIVDDSQAPLKF